MSREDEENSEDLFAKSESLSGEKADLLDNKRSRKTSEELDNEAWQDQILHRRRFMDHLLCLAWTSLIAFLIVIVVHMVVRLLWEGKSGYQGIGDGTMQVMATGIFGEVIAVMATLAIYLWRNPKK